MTFHVAKRCFSLSKSFNEKFIKAGLFVNNSNPVSSNHAKQCLHFDYVPKSRLWTNVCAQSATSAALSVIRHHETTQTLTKVQAQELALRLTTDERKILLNALQEYQSKLVKDEYEGMFSKYYSVHFQFSRTSEKSDFIKGMISDVLHLSVNLFSGYSCCS